MEVVVQGEGRGWRPCIGPDLSHYTGLQDGEGNCLSLKAISGHPHYGLGELSFASPASGASSAEWPLDIQ